MKQNAFSVASKGRALNLRAKFEQLSVTEVCFRRYLIILLSLTL